MNAFRIFFATLVAGAASLAVAQTTNPPAGPHGGRGHGGPGGPGGRGGRHVPPIIASLDLNKDGTLSADEIAQASTSLKALDANKDGKLTVDELRPPRPADAPQPPADAPQRPARHGNPVMLALDANNDHELSASEIANAAASLKALDANKDGSLTPDELHPLPPQ